MFPLSPLASSRLDAMRGLAALAVFVGHARALFFSDYGQVIHPNGLIKALYAATGFGHQAVMVFFVMSGFLITRSIIGAMRQDRWTWGDYALNRLVRLLIVLVPALALGALFDRAGVALFGLEGIYGGRNYGHVVQFPVPDSWGIVPALGNLAFLQTIFVPTFGSNGPLWSLSNEFWYYALFPLLLVGLLPSTALRARLSCLVLAPLVAWMVGLPILSMFPIWLMGSALALMKPVGPRIGRWVLLLGVATLAGSLILVETQRQLSPLAGDYAVATAYSILMVGVLAEPGDASAPWYGRAAAQLAHMSYTLYLVHLPILVFLNAMILGTAERWQPSAGTLATAAALCIAAFAASMGVAALTEARTAKLRGWVRRWLKAPLRPQAQAK